MINIIYIAGGGALGALIRYWVSNSTHSLLGRGFPYGTLTVNIAGSFVIGLLYVVLLERIEDGTALRAGIMIGLLGAFTTFSTFSLETLNLLEAGEHMKAGLNVLLSVMLCLLGCWLGMLLGRQL